MPTIRRFEEILAWQRARVLANLVIKLTGRSSFQRDQRLLEQILGSSDAAGANISEGFGRGTDAQFLQALGVAKGEADETRSHLYRAFDKGYITEGELGAAVALADEVSALICGLMNYLIESPLKGPRFRKKHPFAGSGRRARSRESADRLPTEDSRLRTED